MTGPDIINGVFELGGAVSQLQNCRRMWRDRRVAGVDWRVFFYFTLWGIWNLYYYPSLNQPASFVGGFVLVNANALWLCLAFKFHAIQITRR